MDYRILLAAPLAAVAVSASGGDTMRVPERWMANASYAWPQGATHVAGVAPETEADGHRALTVKAVGKRTAHEIGSIAQYGMGYAGKRVRFSAQVKASGVDGWAGLVVGPSFLPLPYQPGNADIAPEFAARGAAACPQWCDVSVVADIPAGSDGVANLGLALVGNGQVWARRFKLESVGSEVPLTTHRFAVEAGEAMKATHQKVRQLRGAKPTPPQNLALE
jgi:hypothetical protein